MSKERVFVVAGTHDQYLNYVRGKPLNGDKKYVYVSDIIYLRGIINPHGVFIGTWKERDDILAIIDQLMISTSTDTQLLLDIKSDLIKQATSKQRVVSASSHLAREIDAQVMESLNVKKHQKLPNARVYPTSL